MQIYVIVNIKLGTVKLPTLALSELPAQPCCERFWREFKLRSLTDGQLLIKVNLSELTAFFVFFITWCICLNFKMYLPQLTKYLVGKFKLRFLTNSQLRSHQNSFVKIEKIISLD